MRIRQHVPRGIINKGRLTSGHSQAMSSIPILHLFSCRAALRPAVLSAARIWPSVSRYLEISFGLRGPFPEAFTPFRGGLGSLPGAWGAPNKGNADGADGIFGKLRARVGYGPAPGPTQKRPCAIHARKVGRASNTSGYKQYPNTAPLQLSGRTSAGRVICGTDLAECVSVPGDFLRPQGAFPPGFYLLREGLVNHPAPEAPLIRGMTTEP